MMATSELDGTLRVIVPPERAKDFNRRITAFLGSKGFKYESATTDNFLGPPDASCRQASYRYYQTVGCTSRAVVWSDNSSRADEFVITFHHTAFGNRSSAVGLMKELEAASRQNRPL